MCSRFWKDFEDKVISNITNEHHELKKAREEIAFWKSRFKKQKRNLLNVARDDLMRCNLCADFFIYGAETIICECGACYCGDDAGYSICCTGECFSCDAQVCSECSTYCSQCDERYCPECVPEDPSLVFGESDEKIQYCSIECKNKKPKNKK